MGIKGNETADQQANNATDISGINQMQESTYYNIKKYIKDIISNK